MLRMEALRAMPTYEYRCPRGHHFEVFQKMSDEPAAECPECGSPSERLLSGGAGFVFKGEGFYATDYRSPSYKQEAEKERKPKADEASGGGKKKADGAKSAPEKGGAAKTAPPGGTPPAGE